MSKIKIKNFGPIKEGYLEDDGFLEIKKVTLFIGNQGSGKSTVAKLISTMMWLEKAMNRGDLNGVSNAIFKYHLKFQGISEYIKSNSEFEYQGNDKLIFSEQDVIPRIIKIEESKYVTPKIMYVPAARNTLTSITNLSGLPDNLFSFYEYLLKANKELEGERLSLPINGYEYEYDEQSDTTFIVGSDYKLNLLNASSGVQSVAPLFVVTRNLARLVTLPDEIIRKNMKAKSILKMNEEMVTLEVNDSIPETEKIIKRKEIRSKYLPKCFINIVEEPEQNLFPTSQQHILNSLLQFNNQSEGNKLIMTTHSPYILSYLTLAIKAYLVYEQLKSKPGAEVLIDDLDKLVPINSLLKPDDLAIYQLDDNGIIGKLDTYKGLPSDGNYLNSELEETNELFSQLLDLEKSCRTL